MTNLKIAIVASALLFSLNVKADIPNARANLMIEALAPAELSGYDPLTAAEKERLKNQIQAEFSSVRIRGNEERINNSIKEKLKLIKQWNRLNTVGATGVNEKVRDLIATGDTYTTGGKTFNTVVKIIGRSGRGLSYKVSNDGGLTEKSILIDPLPAELRDLPDNTELVLTDYKDHNRTGGGPNIKITDTNVKRVVPTP